MGGRIICKKGGERYHFLLLVVEFTSLNSRVRAPLKLIFIAVIQFCFIQLTVVFFRSKKEEQEENFEESKHS